MRGTKLKQEKKLTENTQCIPKIRRPSEVFKSCPSCESKQIHLVDEQVICLNCSWNSLDVYFDCLFSKIDLVAYEQLKQQEIL